MYRDKKLDRFQREAIEAIDAGRSVLVAAPTGTGKTLVADYLVDKILAEGGRIVYTAPIKALSNQKFREYRAQHGAEKVGIVTGDVVINHDAPLRIMTTEILRNILLQQTGLAGEPAQLGEVRAVIFDELHFMDDPQRGTVWEEVLIYLPSDVTILGLSATLSNLDELALWLSDIHGGGVAVVKENKRAVPLRFRLMNLDSGPVEVAEFKTRYEAQKKERDGRERSRGRGKRDKFSRGRGGGRGNDTEETGFRDMVAALRDEDLPALFFIFSRKGTEACARAASKRRNGFLNGAEREAVDVRLDEFRGEHKGILTPDIERMLRHGIGYHHAGLHVHLKPLVEGLYEARLIKLLFCTSTFALGINMPARTVLFEKLRKYDGEQISPLTVRQFMQKAGRAGRRGLDDAGEVIVKMEYKDWRRSAEHVERLMAGQPEPVKSRFNLSFHSVVNLLEQYDDEEIQRLLSRSFLAWQRAGRQETLEQQISLEEARVRSDERRQADGPRVHDARKRLQKLTRRLERERRWLYDQFLEKVSFLEGISYLTGRELGAGARILKHVQIEEVLVAELVLAGCFEDLSPEELFGVCCGLVTDLPPKVGVALRVPRAISVVLDSILAVVEGEIVEQAMALAGGEPRFDPRLMALGVRWAEGEPLTDLLTHVRSGSDHAGDLVVAFRRAKDLIGQLRHVFAEDPARVKALRAVLRRVTRDEVEAI